LKKIIIILVILSAACKEAYEPPVISTDHAYLVVEGFINNGPDSTLITLSHTYKLNDSSQETFELGATVTVEGNDQSIYHLNEAGNGNYAAPGLALNPAAQYQLHIVTTAGNDYRSDFVPLTTSPPIDSVNWIDGSDGLQLFVNTHDPANASHYYRWSYAETWEFHSIYFSTIRYDNGTLQVRDPEDIYYCWLTDYSSNVLLGSSTKLATDEIFEAPLLVVPQDSWHIGVEYSLLVKQYVLTADAYNFWLNMQRNTEQLGSIFSPQPSELKGNVHSTTDPTEEVIGYVSAGTLSQQRIFITPVQIPNWNTETYPNACTLHNTSLDADSLIFFFQFGGNTPIELAPPGRPPGVEFSIAPCVDCTTMGTNVKPVFWQ
jgi:hypothetical protein